MKWKKMVCQLVETVLVISVYFISCYICMKYYKVQDYSKQTQDVLLIIWNELVNLATLAPVVGAIAINWFMKKYKMDISEPFRISWSIIGVALILFFRVAIVIGIHRVIIALIGLGGYFVCFILAQLFGSKRQREIENLSSTILKNAVGNIKNKDVLGIQLLHMRKSNSNGFVEFHIHNLDNLIVGSSDVNCILSTKMRLKESDFSYFQIALNAYEKIVESGADEYKEQFLKIINDAVMDLKGRLSAINPDNITKDDCCMARLLVCYLTMEKLVDNAEYAVVELEEGKLGIDSILETRLFAYFRTGLLGAILFGSNRRYAFRYRKDGSKAGRKYCAFLVDDINDVQYTKNSDEKLICLVALRENNYKDIPYSVFEYIKIIEKKLVVFFSQKEEGGKK